MKKIVTLIAILCFLLVPSVAYPCSCGTGSPAVEFNRAKAIFIGKILGGTEKLSTEKRNGKSFSIEAGEVRFTVEEVFKGDVPNEVTVHIASHKHTSCGPYGLERGEVYLVYAYGSDQDQETLYSGVCTRTAKVNDDYARKDLDFLRNLPPAGAGGNLQGRIWADLRGGGATVLPGIKVNIRGADNQVITVTTDKDGEFEVKELKAGSYSVEPEFPAIYKSKRKFEKVKIDDLGTALVGFEIYPNGKVSGRMVDQDGQGFNSIFLHLVAGGKEVYGHSSGEDGEFVVDGVPPGEYVLYLEMQGETYDKQKKFYYPGTFERKDAAVIKVELGKEVEGLAFTLPNEYKVRTVEGQVVWKDGKPAANVEVMLLCPQSAKRRGFRIEFSPTTTLTDDEGRFRLEAFTGETYWLEARGPITEDKNGGLTGVHSLSKKIVITENMQGIRLVLSEPGVHGGCGK